MNRIIMGGGMSISVALPSMTAAPSNGKNREIHKGGYKDGLQPNIRLLARGFFIARKKGAFMNDCQRRQIETMRRQGMGYKAIARETKLSRDSVRNYCRWHHLNGYGAAIAAASRKETVYEDIGYGMESPAHRPAEACGI